MIHDSQEAHDLAACYTFIFNELRYSRLAISECLRDPFSPEKYAERMLNEHTFDS